MESIIYWAKDSKFFSHLSRVAPLPPILVHGSRIGYSGLVTELQHRPWKVHISFTPEYCGLLCVHLQDFVFVFKQEDNCSSLSLCLSAATYHLI